jgi:hypothetical protein
VDVCPEIEAIIAAQDGLLHREQAYSAGMSRARLRWWVSRGYWRSVLPAIYATFTGPLSPSQHIVAACLYAGDDAQVTGAAALRLYGVRSAPVDGLVRLLVPHARQKPGTAWVRLHRTRRLDPRPRVVGPIVVASLPRAVIDTARRCSDEGSIRAMLTEVVQQRLSTPAALQAELGAGARQHSAMIRRILRELATTNPPPPPADAARLFARSEVLPPVIWDASLAGPGGRSLPAPDGWIAEVDLGIEIDRVVLHGLPPGFKAPPTSPVARGDLHAQLAPYGALVLRFTAVQLRADPTGVLRTVEQAYLERLRRGIRGTLAVAQPP